MAVLRTSRARRAAPRDRWAVTWLLVALPVVLFATACGGSDGDSAVASLRDSSSPSASPSAGASGGTSEATALKFSQCMRENGVSNFPDPTVDSDGNVSFGNPGSGGLADIDQDVLQKAMSACQEYSSGLGGGFSSEQQTELQDSLLSYAKCMRANGYDLPDPDFSNGGGAAGGNGPFGREIDRDDPTFKKANAACEDNLRSLQNLRPGSSSSSAAS